MKSHLRHLAVAMMLIALPGGEVLAQSAVSPTGAITPSAGVKPAARSAAVPASTEFSAQRRAAEAQLKRREAAAKRTLGSICNGC